MANHAVHHVFALRDPIARESWILYCSYLLSRNFDDINQAVVYARMVLLVPPQGFRNMHMGRSLLRKFQHTRQVEDVTEAVMSFRRALQMFKDEDNDPSYERCLDYMSVAYLERDGNLDALREQNVPHRYSHSRPSYETLNQNLCEGDEVLKYVSQEALYFKERRHSNSRFYIEADPDLDAMIQVYRDALAYFTSISDGRQLNLDGRVLSLTLLGIVLTDKFVVGKEVQDINEAIECLCVRQELLLPNSCTYWAGQCLASRSYLQRYWALREPEDLEKAVDLAKGGVGVLERRYPQFLHNPSFQDCLKSSSFAHAEQFYATKDVKHLDIAIHATSRSVDVTAKDGGERHGEFLKRLTELLGNRYRLSGRAEDLDEMNALAQRALSCWPPNHYDRMKILTNLVRTEVQQYFVHQDESYLHRGWEHLEEACSILAANPGSTEVDLNFYSTLGAFHPIFMNVDSSTWLIRKTRRAMDVSIDFLRKSLSVQHHPLLDPSLSLGICLHSRWLSERNIRDLDEAISVTHRAIKLADEVEPTQSPDLISARFTLGIYLRDRFECRRDEKNREEALSLMLEIFRNSRVTSYERAGAGNMAIDILVKMADWDSACKLSQEVIDLFVLLNDRSQAWPNKELRLRSFSSMPATYTSVALQTGSSVFEAIDMLETCRGSILGQLIDKRADLDELPEAARERAYHFMHLQDEISTLMGSSSDTESRIRETGRNVELEREIRDCLQEIRSMEGCHRFLLGPSETELKAAAVRGPIVIVNVTALRSDALIITKDAFDSMDLPQLQLETVQMYITARLTDFSLGQMRKKNKGFRIMQEWLWGSCVQPIFERLKHFGYGSSKSEKFHVWWMGIGVANFLPFHAAGYYNRGDGETALSHAIFSYIPTLRLLIHSQRKLKNYPTALQSQQLTMKEQTERILTPRLAVITMPTTPGMCNLDGVEEEANMIQTVAGRAFSIQKFVQPSAKETIAYMAQSDVLHIACHGKSDVVDPSRSSIFLQATAPSSTTVAIDKLTLRDVVDANLSHGKLAFLSACSTAQNESASLQDEVLHLVSGFQVAGYLHVIGNLWPADDDRSVELVKAFYKHLVAAGDFGNGDHVAEALNTAVLGLAEKYPRDPLSWAQYVHCGA